MKVIVAIRLFFAFIKWCCCLRLDSFHWNCVIVMKIITLILKFITQVLYFFLIVIIKSIIVVVESVVIIIIIIIGLIVIFIAWAFIWIHPLHPKKVNNEVFTFFVLDYFLLPFTAGPTKFRLNIFWTINSLTNFFVTEIISIITLEYLNHSISLHYFYVLRVCLAC